MMRDIGTTLEAHQLSGSAGTTIGIRRVIALTASPTRAFTAIPSHMRTVALVNTPSARQVAQLVGVQLPLRVGLDLRCSRQHHPRPPRLVQTRDEVYAHRTLWRAVRRRGRQSRIIESPSDHGITGNNMTLPSAAFPIVYDCNYLPQACCADTCCSHAMYVNSKPENSEAFSGSL